VQFVYFSILSLDMGQDAVSFKDFISFNSVTDYINNLVLHNFVLHFVYFSIVTKLGQDAFSLRDFITCFGFILQLD
jgi:polynucleotide 5'-kinase involved in rRNA processing